MIEHRPSTINSIGWVVRETKDFLTITAHKLIDEDGDATQGNDAMSIPRGCIRKVRNVPRFKI